MDLVLARIGFAKCYIDDIIIFNPTLRDHEHHLQEIFGRFKDHNLKLHPSKCWFFQTQVDWGYKRPRLRPFHKYPN
jgi:hypothetical protein